MLVHCQKTLADIIDPLRSPRCSQAQTYEQRKEHACWKVQVNVDSTYRGRLLLLIEGGGDEKNMECPMLFSAPQPPPPPPLSPTFYFVLPPLASQNYFTYYKLERNDYGQLIDRSLIPKVHVFFFTCLFFKNLKGCNLHTVYTLNQYCSRYILDTLLRL